MESIQVPSVPEKKFISDDFFPETKGWLIDDASIGTFGRLALSGRIMDKTTTFTALCDTRGEKASIHDDIFWQEHHNRQSAQLIALNQEYQRVVTASSGFLRCHGSDKNTFKGDYKLTLKAACVSSHGQYVFVSFENSNILSMFDLSLKMIRNVFLEGLIEADFPFDLKATSQMCLICTSGGAKPLAFERETGKFVREYQNPFGSNAKACSISSIESSGVVVVLWDSIQVLLYAEEDSSYKYIIKVSSCSKLRISDSCTMVAINSGKTLVHVYQIDMYINYANFISKLSRLLSKRDCEKLASHFKLEKGDTRDIMRSEQPAISLLRFLGNNGTIKPGNTLELLKALHVAEMSTHLSEMYTFQLHTQDILKAEKAQLERTIATLRQNLQQQKKSLEYQKDTMKKQRELLVEANKKIKTLEGKILKDKQVSNEMISKQKTESEMLKKSMKEANGNIEKLEMKITTLLRDKQACDELLSKERSTSSTLEDSLKQAKIRRNRLEGTLKELQEQNQTVNDQLSKEKQVLKVLDESLATAKMSNKDLEEANFKLRKEMEDVKQELSKEKETSQLLDEALVKARTSVGNLEVETKTLQAQKKDLQDELNKERKTVHSLKETLEQGSHVNTKLEEEIKQLQTEKRTVDDILSSEKDTSESLKRSLTEAEVTIQELEKCISTMHSNVEDTKEELTTERERLTSLESKVKDERERLERETTEIEKDLLKIKEETETTSNSVIQVLEEEIAQYENKKEQAKESLAELSTEKMTREMNEAQSNALKFEQQKNDIVDKKQRLYGEISAGEKEIEQMDGRVLELKSSIKEMQDLYKILGNEHTQLADLLLKKGEKELKQSTSYSLQCRLETTMEDMKRLDGDLSVARKKLQEFEIRLSEVQSNLRKMKDTRLKLISEENAIDDQIRKEKDAAVQQSVKYSTAEAAEKELKLQINFYEEKINIMDARLRNEGSKSSDIQRSLQAALSLILNVRRQHLALEAKNVDLNEKLKAEEARLESSLEHSKDLEDRVNVLTEQQKTFTQAMNEEEPIVTDFNQMRDKLQATSNEIMENFRQEQNSLEQEHRQVVQTLLQEENASSLLKEKLNMAKSEAHDLQAQKETQEEKEKQLEETKKRVTDDEKRIQDLLFQKKLQIQDAENRITNLLETKGQTEYWLRYHKQQMDQRDSKIQELEKKLAELEEENKQLNDELAAAMKASEEYKSLLQKAQKEKDIAEQNLIMCKMEQTRLATELEEKQQESMKLNLEMSQTKQTIADLKTQKENNEKTMKSLNETFVKDKERSEKLRASLQQVSDLTEELKKQNILLQYERDHLSTSLKAEKIKLRKLHEYFSEAEPSIDMLNKYISIFKTEKLHLETISDEEIQTSDVMVDELIEQETEGKDSIQRKQLQNILSKSKEIYKIGGLLQLKNQSRIQNKQEKIGKAERNKAESEKEFQKHMETIENNTKELLKDKEGLTKFQSECSNKLEQLKKEEEEKRDLLKEDDEKIKEFKKLVQTNTENCAEQRLETKVLKRSDETLKDLLSNEEDLSESKLTEAHISVVLPSIDRKLKHTEEELNTLKEEAGRLENLLTVTQSRRSDVDLDLFRVKRKKEEVEKSLETKLEEIKTLELQIEEDKYETRYMQSAISAAENEKERQKDKLQDEMQYGRNLSRLLSNARTTAYVLLKTNIFLEDSSSTLLKNVKSFTEKLNITRGLLPKNAYDNDDLTGVWRHPDELRAASVLPKGGGILQIHGTEISLTVPEGALEEQCVIKMNVIPQGVDPADEPASFSTNSALIVELLPNNFELKKSVELRIPHCLILEQGFRASKSADVLISHHEEGTQPKWENAPDIECDLQENGCILRLKKFCWVTYKVKDEIIVAKRLKVFTAGRQRQLGDRESDVEVGYFPDIPGKGEILRLNRHLKIGQCKPFSFRKTNNEAALEIKLTKITPRVWESNSTFGDSQEISYESISTDREKSCRFNLRYRPEQVPREIPFCIFDVVQQEKRMIITFRPEVNGDETEDEETDVEEQQDNK